MLVHHLHLVILFLAQGPPHLRRHVCPVILWVGDLVHHTGSLIQMHYLRIRCLYGRV
jgi:hypothetical protein